MKLKGGYFQKILDFDLSDGKANVLRPDEEFALKYIGGRGYGAKMVYDNLRRHDWKINPLGPENILVIAPGPLTGCYLPSSGRNSFISISPATGIYGDSSMGGHFGVGIRQAGWDAVVIRGKAPELGYLFIDGTEARFIARPELAGKPALETEKIVRKDINDVDARIAVIGPGGENGVVFGCVNADWSRNAGRTGIGAIMGKKNVKAIAVRGAADLPIADVPKLMEIGHRAYAELSSHKLFKFWQQQGLMSVIDYVNTAGVMPTYNFRDAYFDRANKINGYEMEANYKIGDSACFGCSMTCGNVNLVHEGKYAGTVTEGPEYESACMFGSNLGVDDFGAVLRACQLCDEMGVDTISMGALIGVLIEGYETGILTLDDIGGKPIHWGDDDRINELIEQTALREGVGDLLAQGALALIEKYPKLAPITSHSKGLEQSAYDARVATSMALAYGTSDIGAHHTRAWTLAKEMEMGLGWEPEKKVDLVIYHQTIRPLFDMFGVCRLPWIELGFPEKYYEEFYAAVTGVERSMEELLNLSGDIYDLTRIINTRLGKGRVDDYPPPRVFDTPIQSGPQAGKHLERKDYENLLDIYYKKRNWDNDGNVPPKREKLFQDTGPL